jgi:hypothetical protein
MANVIAMALLSAEAMPEATVVETAVAARLVVVVVVEEEIDEAHHDKNNSSLKLEKPCQV